MIAKTLIFAVLCSLVTSPTFAQSLPMVCGELKNGYGPYDYRKASVENRSLVESFHFTSKVENLRGGNNTLTPGGDLAYTLRVFPNHPRALMATVRFAEQAKRNPPPEMIYSVSCWFERAEAFRDDDATVKMLYGAYLVRSGKPQEGIQKLEAALELSDEDTNVLYNLGLTYFELKDFDKSLELAHRAYAAGFPLPGLRNKLKRAGKWKEIQP